MMTITNTSIHTTPIPNIELSILHMHDNVVSFVCLTDTDNLDFDPLSMDGGDDGGDPGIVWYTTGP